MMYIKKQKEIIRRRCAEKRRAISGEVKQAYDERLCRAVMSLASYRYADILLLYAAEPEEPNLLSLAEAALSCGKRIAFPRCNTHDHTLTFHFVDALNQLSPSTYGIRAPEPTLPPYHPQTDPGSALCLVPGVAFDRQGYRIGYGKGYYDRFLSGFRGSSVGIVYHDCILDTLPRGRYDIPVHILLTEKGVVPTGK